MSLPMTSGGQLHLVLSVCSGEPQKGKPLYTRVCTRALRAGRKPPHLRRFEEHLSLLALFGLLHRAAQGWQLTRSGEDQLDHLGPWTTCPPRAGRTRGNAVAGDGRGNPAPLSTQIPGGSYA